MTDCAHCAAGHGVYNFSRLCCLQRYIEDQPKDMRGRAAKWLMDTRSPAGATPEGAAALERSIADGWRPE